MSNQLSIQAALAIQGVFGGTAPSPSAAPASAPAATPSPLFLNPSFQFDPTVGLEVINFRDESGKLLNSIPSQAQLAAYRDHQATPPGEQMPQAPKTPGARDDKTSSG